jgi:hypothetical protein
MRLARVVMIGAFGITLMGQGARGEPSLEVRQYNEAYEPAGDYYQVVLGSHVRILATKPNETFEFEAGMWDGETYLEPADISEIVALDNLGDVTITLTGHAGTYGAHNVGEINISPNESATTHGHVAYLKLSGSLGDAEHESGLLADSAGTLSIGTPAIGTEGAAHGDVIKPVHILGDVDSLAVRGAVRPEGTVTIDGDLGALLIGTLSGGIAVNGDLGRGAVSIDRLDGTLTVAQGNVTGAVDVDELVGCFNIEGDLEPPPLESADFDVTILAGTLKTAGDLDGDGDFWTRRRS